LWGSWDASLLGGFPGYVLPSPGQVLCVAVLADGRCFLCVCDFVGWGSVGCCVGLLVGDVVVGVGCCSHPPSRALVCQSWCFSMHTSSWATVWQWGGAGRDRTLRPALCFLCLIGLLGMFLSSRWDDLCRWGVGVMEGWKGVYAGVVGI